MKRCFLVLSFLCFILLSGCKAGEKVISKREITTRITEREVTVLTPEKNLTITGKLKKINPGLYKAEDVDVKGGAPGTKLSLMVDTLGNIVADVTIPPDSAKAKVTDKETTINNEKEITKGPSWWDKFKIGLIAIGLAAILGCVTYIVYKNRK